jgi:hypothetical protein
LREAKGYLEASGATVEEYNTRVLKNMVDYMLSYSLFFVDMFIEILKEPIVMEKERQNNNRLIFGEKAH